MLLNIKVYVIKQQTVSQHNIFVDEQKVFFWQRTSESFSNKRRHLSLSNLI